MLKIAVYGKGGIGKSTTVSNLSCALAKQGRRVMQIGCDPKADSTCNLMGGKRIPTILDTIRSHGEDVRLTDIVFSGEAGVLCAEAGGPAPGRGCAGKGIVTAFDRLAALHAFEICKPDVVLYEESLDQTVIEGAVRAIADAEVLIVGGTSLTVYPAAGLIRYYRGNKLVLINRDETPYDTYANLIFRDPIGKVLGAI